MIGTPAVRADVGDGRPAELEKRRVTGYMGLC
jgi:hypothetical protein